MQFTDRAQAGTLLAERLGAFARRPEVIVLGLPRGGVPVAYAIAERLRVELDVLIVRKLGAPGHPELGIGAVVDGSRPYVVLNEDVIRQVRPSDAYIEQEKQRELTEIERRRQRYVGDRAATAVEGRTAIVIDDGIATGGTVRAALRGMADSRPARLVLAVPIAPADSAADLADECDEVVCLAAPPMFHAVGQFYGNFDQVEDDEVVACLARFRGEPGA